MGDFAAAIADQFLFYQILAAGSFLHKGAWRLAPFLVGFRDHGGKQDGRMLVKRFFDLDGGNVLAPGNYDVFRAVFQLNITVGMKDADIA